MTSYSNSSNSNAYGRRIMKVIALIVFVVLVAGGLVFGKVHATSQSVCQKQIYSGQITPTTNGKAAIWMTNGCGVNGASYYLIENGVVHNKKPWTLNKGETKVVVIKGLKPGTQLVLSGPVDGPPLSDMIVPPRTSKFKAPLMLDKCSNTLTATALNNSTSSVTFGLNASDSRGSHNQSMVVEPPKNGQPAKPHPFDLNGARLLPGTVITTVVITNDPDNPGMALDVIKVGKPQTC